MNEMETDEDPLYDLITMLLLCSLYTVREVTLSKQRPTDPLEMFQHIFSAVIRFQRKERKKPSKH